MNQSAQPLHIWIFNDASIVSLLHANSPLWPDFTPGLLAELASAPILAHVLNLETPPSYPGLAGLLGSSTSPADLTVPMPNLMFPVILSSATNLAPAAAIAAIRRFLSDSRIVGPRVLILEAALACALVPALACADKIGMVWDFSCPPGDQLQFLLNALDGENLLRPSHWAGLIGYFSPDHQATEDESAAAAAMLAPFSFARMLNN
jgi:hypothetical protein